MGAIYRRELNSYFQSMTGYVFVAFMVVIAGIYFMAYNLNAGYPYFSYSLSGLLFVLIIAVPVLTMKSFAEERKNRTDQLLLTSPVGLFSIVMGKYFAMMTVMAIPNLIYCLFPLIIKSQGTAYLRTDYLAICAFFLLGCVYIGIGMFLSSLTESQVIAAVSSIGVLLVLYLWDGILSYIPENALSGLIGAICLLTLAVLFVYKITESVLLSVGIEIVGLASFAAVYLVKPALFEHLLTNILGKFVLYTTFTDIESSHIFDLGGILFYLSLIAVFLFLTIQVIQKRRWS